MDGEDIFQAVIMSGVFAMIAGAVVWGVGAPIVGKCLLLGGTVAAFGPVLAAVIGATISEFQH